MGFEIYLQCFGLTAKTGLARDAIRSLFPIDEPTSEPDYWRVRYDRLNSCDIGVGSLPQDRTRLAGLFVNRPCGDARLWESLFAILEMGQVVLFFPGGPLIIAHAADASELPAEMKESLGQPVCVDSGGSILRVVEQS